MGECIMLHRVKRRIPKFTYTGSYELIDDGHGNWRIKFKTSGTLTFTRLGNAKDGIDVFLVGGGGGGATLTQNPQTCAGAGGSGYTLTKKDGSIKPVKDTGYSITIGAAGAAGTWASATSGGSSKAFGLTAAGGVRGRCGHNSSYDVYWSEGGNGGSGGGRDNSGANPRGGTNGGDGSSPEGTEPSNYHGRGQKKNPGPNNETGNTYEFGEETSGNTLYAQGGGKTTPYKANSGNGGCSYYNGVEWWTTDTIAASSGIVVIRNHR